MFISFHLIAFSDPCSSSSSSLTPLHRETYPHSSPAQRRRVFRPPRLGICGLWGSRLSSIPLWSHGEPRAALAWSLCCGCDAGVAWADCRTWTGCGLCVWSLLFSDPHRTWTWIAWSLFCHRTVIDPACRRLRGSVSAFPCSDQGSPLWASFS